MELKDLLSKKILSNNNSLELEKIETLDLLEKIKRVGYYNEFDIYDSLYEKTMIYFIINYLEDPICIYSISDWKKFCMFYGIDFGAIENFIEKDIKFEFLVFKDSIVDLKKYDRDTNIIYDMFRYYLIIETLEEIKIDNSLKSIEHNIKHYKNISHYITILNANVSTRECMNKGYFAKELIPQEFTLGNINGISNILNIMLFSYDEYKDMLESLYQLYNNDIKKYADMIFIILSLQIIRSSPFTESDLILINEKLISIMIDILKNTKVLKIFHSNFYFYFNKNKNWSERGSDDQTTRLQILYQYSNGDQYNLRLDFSHKGIEFFHINNESKGGVKYFPIDNSQLEYVCSIKPEYRDWFITYNNKYHFLREKYKKIIYNTEHRKIMKLLNENQHFTLPDFSNEKDILDLFDSWTKLFLRVGESMPKEKLDPKKIYIQQTIYEILEEYLLIRMLGEKENEMIFKSKIVSFFIKQEIFSEDEIDKLHMEYRTIDIISYAMLLLQE